MNYACAFLALIAIFSTVYWYAAGKRFYTGPLIEADIGDSASNSSGVLHHGEKSTL